MSFKNSGLNVQKNSKIWTKSLKKFQDSVEIQRNIPDVEKPLYKFNKIPSEKNVIGRFHALAISKKSKKDRYVIICNELNTLWDKLNIAKLSKRSVMRKVENLMKLYEDSLKYYDNTNFRRRFTITKENIEPQLALSSDMDIVHCPLDNMSDADSFMTCKYEEDYLSEDSEYQPPKRIKPNRLTTKPAVKLVTNAKVSTRKAEKICKELAEAGVNIPTPSQAAIYKAVIKSSEQKEEFLKATLKNENWCLHFDGKKINKKELQVVVLKNELREVYLAVLVLDDGKALTIFNGLKEILTKFDLWENIKMVICDTTSVNTGSKNGVVAHLKNYYNSINIPPPQYIGCQHHILDLILRHVMDELIVEKSSSPEISYDFVEELVNNYKELQTNFKQTNDILEVKTIKWRDDMQFLYELGAAFRYFQINKKFPKIKFKSIPPLSNARWNSRAILAILAFILIPKYRTKLYPICQFISGKWYDIWFSNHCFNEENYKDLQQSLSQFQKAKACFERHWVKEPSAIPFQQRSNICAERGIKVAQDIFPICKSPRTLNLKFISFNSI